MKVTVVRHGRTELNTQGLINGWLDDALTPEGEAQVRAMVPLLPKTLKRMYVSSLARTRQTAAIINETLHVPIVTCEELKEVNFGVLNGTPYLDTIREKHMSMQYDWRPSGECVAHVRARVLKILTKIKSENGDGEVLIVTSGGVIRMMHWLQYGETLGAVENANMYTFDLDLILR